MLLLEAELELDEAELDEAELDEAELDEAELDEVPLMPKQVPIDGETAGASHEGFVLSAALTQMPTPSLPPAAVSHLPVPQSASVQQKCAHEVPKQASPAPQKGPLLLLQAPQRIAVFGGSKHTKPASCTRSHVAPLATSQPAPVTGLQGGGSVKHSILQDVVRHSLNTLRGALALQTAGSAFGERQPRQSASSLQLTTS